MGSTLFSVMARNLPEGQRGSEVVNIADIRMNSNMITSRFGDERLFFQHRGMREDHELQPQWRRHIPQVQDTDWPRINLDEWPTDDDEAKAWFRGSVSEHKCPFAWLLGNEINPIFD